jgi:hypothetical protein
MSITHCTEPQTYQEASKSECWVLAMKDELEALKMARGVLLICLKM